MRWEKGEGRRSNKAEYEGKGEESRRRGYPRGVSRMSQTLWSSKLVVIIVLRRTQLDNLVNKIFRLDPWVANMCLQYQSFPRYLWYQERKVCCSFVCFKRLSRQNVPGTELNYFMRDTTFLMKVIFAQIFFCSYKEDGIFVINFAFIKFKILARGLMAPPLLIKTDMF